MDESNSVRSIFSKIWTQPLWLRLTVSVLLVIIFCWFVFYALVFRTPANFPVKIIYTIEKGQNLGSVASDLEKNNIIRSAWWFKAYFSVRYGGAGVNFGDYSLDKKEGALAIAKRLARSDFRIKTIKITIREGLNSKEIGALLEENFFKITGAEFQLWAKRYEGRLFPDTYKWSENQTPDKAVSALILNFDKQTEAVRAQASSTKKNFSDILKVASIIELEANNDIDRHIISDIFWRRLAIGMPLQANSTLKYINVQNTFILSNDDKKIDSPYNTYMYRGLPPTPVCNPGLAAIEASLNPTKTKYLYFLTGRDGKTYYATTYEEHLANKAKYLK